MRQIDNASLPVYYKKSILSSDLELKQQIFAQLMRLKQCNYTFTPERILKIEYITSDMTFFDNPTGFHGEKYQNEGRKLMTFIKDLHETCQ